MLAIKKWVLIAFTLSLSLISILAGFAIGNYFGVKNGVKIEAGKNALTAAKEAVKSQSIKEKNHAATSRLSNDSVNSGLDALGLLRDATGD